MSYDIVKERNEAITAGEQALMSLHCARDELNRARNWGIFDMFSRGGLLSAFVKRSRMKNAQMYMDRAKEDLQIFNRELSDVRIHTDLHIETDDFLSFADWFFDNIFVDWMVQDRIKTAISQVDTAIDNVNSALYQLRRY